MTDNTELKRLAEHHLSLGQAYTVAKPSVLLALIADNERLTAAIGSQAIRRFVGQDDQKKMDELVSAGIQVDKDRIAQLEAERDQLKAENERLEIERAELWRGKRDVEATRDTKSAVIAELRAEIAGLKTGYEAYEQVNAELKAENERLERNRDMWKGQVDRQCETIEGLRKALKTAEDAMWYADGNMDGEAADARDALADLGQGEQS